MQSIQIHQAITDLACVSIPFTIAASFLMLLAFVGENTKFGRKMVHKLLKQ